MVRVVVLGTLVDRIANLEGGSLARLNREPKHHVVGIKDRRPGGPIAVVLETGEIITDPEVPVLLLPNASLTIVNS